MGKVDPNSDVVTGAFWSMEGKVKGKIIYEAVQRPESEWGEKKVNEFYFE